MLLVPAWLILLVAAVNLRKGLLVALTVWILVDLRSSTERARAR